MSTVMSSSRSVIRNPTKGTERSIRPGLRRGTQHGGLSVNGALNFDIPTQQGEREHVEAYHGKDSWRMKILKFCHQKRVQYGLMALLTADVILIFTELFLLTQYPACDIIERDCISCCEHSADNVRFLAGGKDEHEEICESGLEPDYDTGGCDPHKWERIHSVESVIFAITVCILAVFFLELNLQAVALGPSVFFHQLFLAFDYVVVAVSLFLELLLHFLHEDRLATLFGLLIFARIWRFIRIGHGIVEVTSELIHARHEDVFKYIVELENVITDNKLTLPKRPPVVKESLSSIEEDEDDVYSE